MILVGLAVPPTRLTASSGRSPNEVASIFYEEQVILFSQIRTEEVRRRRTWKYGGDEEEEAEKMVRRKR